MMSHCRVCLKFLICSWTSCSISQRCPNGTRSSFLPNLHRLAPLASLNLMHQAVVSALTAGDLASLLPRHHRHGLRGLCLSGGGCAFSQHSLLTHQICPPSTNAPSCTSVRFSHCSALFPRITSRPRLKRLKPLPMIAARYHILPIRP